MLHLLLACGAPIDVVADPKPHRDGAHVEPITGDTGPDTDPVDTGTEFEGDDAWIFDDAVIHDVDITLGDDAKNALANDPYTYVSGDFTMDGQTVATVGVRLRGKVGSFRTLDGKPKFKFDFGEFVDGQEFYGLKSISLNNEVVDCSYLKEPLAYRVFRDAGVPAGRTSFARVTVNGEAFGLYVVVEVPDKRFLKRHYEDADGNFYDGKYLYDWHTGNYAMVDFSPTLQGNFQLEEGDSVDLEDIKAITRALGGVEEEGFTTVDTLVDMEEVHREWAVEQWTGHIDGYAMNQNNYRVYFDPADGRAELVPWDFDYAFLNDSDWGMSWTYPRARMASKCWADADCAAAQGQAVGALLDSVDVAGLQAQLAAWSELIGADAHSDPRRECSIPSIDSTQAWLVSWIDSRDATLRASWGL